MTRIWPPSLIQRSVESLLRKIKHIPTPSNIFQGADEEKLIITEVQTHEMRKYLLSIDPNKSVGPDEISPRLKECCAQLETPITSLFNKSLTQARVPRAWKKGKHNPHL